MIKRNLVVISFVLLGACSTTPSSVQEAPAKAEAPLAQIEEMAKHYERAGEHDKALVYYLKALENAPKDIDLTYRVAELHKQMGKPQFALHMLERIIAAEPTHINALTDAAKILLQNKELAKATDYFARVTALDQARLKEKANIQSFYAGTDASSPLDAYNGLGVAYDLMGSYDKAKEMYALSLQIDPYSPVVLTNMGYSHYLSGNYSAAISAFHKAIDAAPSYERSWTNLGLVYARMGRYNKAFQTLKRVMEDAQAYNDLGYFLMLEQRYEEAEYFFEQAISASPKYYEVAYENLSDVRQHLSVIKGEGDRFMP